VTDQRPGVSFVVPVLNGERWLDGVLSAILAQDDGRPLEVIVVDDGSTDRSLELIGAYVARRRIRALTGEGRGVAAAMNLGIRHAVHPIICQIDQDVILAPGWLAHVTDALDRHGAAACQGYYVTSSGAGMWARVAGLDLEQRYGRLRGPHVDHVCTGNSAYRADALRRVNFFDETLGYGADNDMSYRLTDAGYRLAFCRAARSVHHWREDARGYFAQQYGVGYGRLDVTAKHAARLAGDDTSGPGMIAHAALMLLALVSLAVAAVNALMGGASKPAALLAGLVLVVLAVERFVAGVRAACAFRDSAGLWFAPVHLLRDVAWGLAIGVWMCRRLLGRRPRPCHSMGIPPARTRPQSSSGQAGLVTNERDVLVLIPARNEAANLPRVVGELRRCFPDVAVLVVDDCSDDETALILPTLGVRWLRLEHHLGIGGAMRAGLRFARHLGYDIVVRLDGDGQHEPSEIARLLAPIRSGEADAVQGSRYANDPGVTEPWLKRTSRQVLATVLSQLTRGSVTDPTSGFWVFGPRAVHLLGDHHASGYPEPELLLFLHRNRLRVIERPTTMRPRLAGHTSLTARRIGPAIARLLLVTIVVPLRPMVKVGSL
jgi:glycosyltransferase involved in cell wall biosynthesis